jgi:hypothetical protein
MSTGRQGEAVPSAKAERRRNQSESVGVWIYSFVAVALMVAILGIVYLA